MSCAVAIHVLTASGRLLAHAGRIGDQVRAAAMPAVEALPLDGGDVDVVVRDDPRLVIPEVGLGGFAADGYTVFIALDPVHEHFEWALEHELFRTLAHELHHVARRRRPALGRTLLDALVGEGLADHFSIELTGMDPPPWAVALDAEQTTALRGRARNHYDDPTYDHRAWFFGSGELGLPRWTGYSLGFELVGDYLERHPQSSAAMLATAPTESLRPTG